MGRADHVTPIVTVRVGHGVRWGRVLLRWRLSIWKAYRCRGARSRWCPNGRVAMRRLLGNHIREAEADGLGDVRAIYGKNGLVSCGGAEGERAWYAGWR